MATAARPGAEARETAVGRGVAAGAGAAGFTDAGLAGAGRAGAALGGGTAFDDVALAANVALTPEATDEVAEVALGAECALAADTDAADTDAADTDAADTEREAALGAETRLGVCVGVE